MGALRFPIAPERQHFLERMRRVPGAVAIVAAAHEGQRAGLTATAWNSLCADPPMLLACVNRATGAHPLVLGAGAFSVNLVPASASETVSIFAAKCGLSGNDRFRGGDWIKGPAGQPLFVHTIAAFECTLEAIHDHGTHSVLIGRIGHIAGSSTEDPLIYLDGGYAAAVRQSA